MEFADEPVVPAEPAQDRRPVAAHLLGLLDRHAHLRLQRGRAAVPEEMLAPGQVPQRRRVAPQGRARERACASAAVRERPLRPVAAGARAVALAGEPRVGEQLAPSAIFSGVSGLSGGDGGGVAGRLNICRHTASTLAPCAIAPDTPSGVRTQSNARAAAMPKLVRIRGMRGGPWVSGSTTPTTWRRFRLQGPTWPHGYVSNLRKETSASPWSGLSPTNHPSADLRATDRRVLGTNPRVAPLIIPSMANASAPPRARRHSPGARPARRNLSPPCGRETAA